MRLGIYFFISVLSYLLLSGCFGGIVAHTVECEFDYPIVNYAFNKYKFEPSEGAEVRNFSRMDFLRDWGEPDEIIKVSINSEILIYNKKDEYCGIIPMLIVPVPLVLPTCEVFDAITFENDLAVHVHFKRRTYTGAAFGLLGEKESLAQVSTECPNQKNHDDAVEKRKLQLQLRQP